MASYHYQSNKGNGFGDYTLTTEEVDGEEIIVYCNDDTSGSGNSQVYSLNEKFEGKTPEPRVDFYLAKIE
ncbi:hypothetical protein [Nostoc sp.]|uniref:hypothetical protein n=1 Tax=Nostoc sp. TaxID=1180 RepID=UPI002FFBEC79